MQLADWGFSEGRLRGRMEGGESNEQAPAQSNGLWGRVTVCEKQSGRRGCAGQQGQAAGDAVGPGGK